MHNQLFHASFLIFRAIFKKTTWAKLGFCSSLIFNFAVVIIRQAGAQQRKRMMNNGKVGRSLGVWKSWDLSFVGKLQPLWVHEE